MKPTHYIDVDYIDVYNSDSSGESYYITTLVWGDKVNLIQQGEGYVKIEYTLCNKAIEKLQAEYITGFILLNDENNYSVHEILRPVDFCTILKLDFYEYSDVSSVVIESPKGNINIIEGGKYTLLADLVSRAKPLDWTDSLISNESIVVMRGTSEENTGLTEILYKEYTNQKVSLKKVYIDTRIDSGKFEVHSKVKKAFSLYGEDVKEVQSYSQLNASQTFRQNIFNREAVHEYDYDYDYDGVITSESENASIGGNKNLDDGVLVNNLNRSSMADLTQDNIHITSLGAIVKSGFNYNQEIREETGLYNLRFGKIQFYFVSDQELIPPKAPRKIWNVSNNSSYSRSCSPLAASKQLIHNFNSIMAIITPENGKPVDEEPKEASLEKSYYTYNKGTYELVGLRTNGERVIIFSNSCRQKV